MLEYSKEEEIEIQKIVNSILKLCNKKQGKRWIKENKKQMKKDFK
ncbi:MAG: hypothetical protein ABIB46_03945 [bacterium]